MTNDQAILDLIGDPHEVDRELRSFRRTARILSSDHPRLIDKYSGQWIAAYDGKVRAFGRTLHSVLSKVEKQGIPKRQVIVRYIDKNQRTMIL